jgi:parvulin-like peptidyl-prolyl isomerase
MRLHLLFLILAALVLGLAVGELLYRSAAVRDLAGRLTGRGRLVALANEKGIYETDLGGDSGVSVEELVLAENLKRSAANEAVEPAAIDREIALIEAQFGDLKAFQKALAGDGLSLSALRQKVADHLRGLAWMEKQIRPVSAVTEPECRRFYETHPDLFTQPVRFRASHLLLAAHAETPPEIVEEKELAIAVLSARLEKGEALTDLAAEASEDEATKARGGDLGFFADARMPPDFMIEINKLRPGETGKTFRSHLGFHLAQLTEVRNGRLLTFEEARPEISLALANERRADFAHQIAAKLSAPD